jgi:hypothetical protein
VYPVQSARRVAKRDAVHRASGSTLPMGRILSPETAQLRMKKLKMGRTIWHAGVVGPPLWWETPPRVTRLASVPNRPGQMTLIDRKML